MLTQRSTVPASGTSAQKNRTGCRSSGGLHRRGSTTIASVKVTFVAESFLPQVNGVTNSVLRMLEHLRNTGHDAMVIAPSESDKVPAQYAGFPVHSVPSLGLPGYGDVRVSAATQRSIERLLINHEPDVLHVAAPFAVGYKALLSAAKLHIPSVALYQTQLAAYARRYGVPALEAVFWARLKRAHSLATLNFAPSTHAREQLIAHGIPRVGIWARGVDSVRFHPANRDDELHARWAPNDERIIGYMGRLANEKRVADLAALNDIPNTQIVIVGDGPDRKMLESVLPQAIFTGQQLGESLPRHLASFDLFVHTGDLETFGQAIQEAEASGLPVIAPGRGGPVDLIDPSRTGWLYTPGDLRQMRSHVVDLIGDDAKRAAFGRAARASVEHRTWPFICAQLVQHYEQAIKVGAPRPGLTRIL